MPKRPIEKKEDRSDKDISTEELPSYRERMKKVQEKFEEIQSKAVLEPTLENVQILQRAQATIMDQSEGFAKMWMLASMVNSENYKESDQPYPAHRQIYKEQQNKKLDEKIRDLTKTYGLFFIFKKDCPYCHEFAPLVKEFIKTYGFEYKAISPDGSPLPEFPDTQNDNGAIQLLNPEGIFPVLYLVNPETNEVIPLSRGLVNLDHLKDNMKTIVHHLEGN